MKNKYNRDSLTNEVERVIEIVSKCITAQKPFCIGDPIPHRACCNCNHPLSSVYETGNSISYFLCFYCGHKEFSE